IRSIPIVHGVSEHRGGLGADVKELPGLGIGLPSENAAVLREIPETLFALPQCGLGKLAPADLVLEPAIDELEVQRALADTLLELALRFFPRLLGAFAVGDVAGKTEQELLLARHDQRQRELDGER